MSAASHLNRLEFTVNITAAGGKTQQLNFDKTITIGRSPENDIVLSNDPRVSRKHVRLQVEQGQLKVINLSPKNEIKVDDKSVEEYYVNNGGCKIALGQSIIEIKAKSMYGSAESVPLQALSPLAPANPAHPSEVKPLQGSAQSVPGLYNNQVFASPAQQPQQTPKPEPKRKNPSLPTKKPKPILMIVIVLILFGGIYLYLDEGPKKGEALEIRSAQQRQEDEARALMTIDEERRRKEDSGQSTKMYDSAQGYYVRGFRDYRQGQFRRAMQSFQAALSFYPDHQLARKYLKLAEVQADKTDRLNMQQGRKYKSRGNYDLCESSFQKVMTSIKDPENAVYKEAKILYDVCRTLAEDKY